MYDIKSIEFGQQLQQQQQIATNININNCITNNSSSNKIEKPTTAPINLPNNFGFYDHHHPPALKAASLNFVKGGRTLPLSGGGRSATKISCIAPPTERSLTSIASSINACTSLQSAISNHCSSSCTTSALSSSHQQQTQMTLVSMSLRRRRILQRQACLLSIVAAFMFGLILGVFMPIMGLTSIFSIQPSSGLSNQSQQKNSLIAVPGIKSSNQSQQSDDANLLPHPPSDFPTIYELHDNDGGGNVLDKQNKMVDGNLFSVSFIKEKVLPAEEVFRNAFHLEQDKKSENSMIVKKLDASDGTIKEFHVQRTSDGRFRKGPERRLSKPSVSAQVVSHDQANSGDFAVNFIPIARQIIQNTRNTRNYGIIKGDIYWGDLVEQALPRGFSARETDKWNTYIRTAAVVKHLQLGCGRMQNRLVIFADGTRACARYRQNTDQIQGELFSFYLGQILNLTNLAPSAASVIDLDSTIWSSAVEDITNAQWKSARPVVLTRWLPDLEPAGIPIPFQPLERHLNKYDVWNITLGKATLSTSSSSSSSIDFGGSGSGNIGKNSETFLPLAASSSSSNENQKGLIKRLGAARTTDRTHQSSKSLTTTMTTTKKMITVAAAEPPTTPPLNSTVLQRLIELAQWSDLIVFDYLIANLDRVVNNLYNYQWNVDIMAAPAHNLARQTNTQLLVFLDNESGLLHGYRLLKKYEAYHGLLLDNLCVFRRPTIEALQRLRDFGAGRRLHELFETATSQQIRDVLPSLPDKSIKILIDRIDRILGQVQKCRDLFSER